MTIKGLAKAVATAIDRMRRAKGKIGILYIVEIEENGYILCTQAFLPQLSEHYEYFKIVKMLKYDI